MFLCYTNLMTNNDKLKDIPALINKTFPIPARFRSRLPADIAELSHLLTNKRGDRSLSYLGRPNFLSAYLHYFLPWNIYRLCALLKDADIKLSAGDTITDLGSGPLTLVSALWIARPNLRNIPLEINCIDRSRPALEAGKKFFETLAKDSPWKINLVREEIGPRITRISRITQITRITRIKEEMNVKLVCAVNLFNEMYENIPHSNTEELKNFASNAARFMHKLAAADAYILTVEPGVPQSGKFISFLREVFLELGRPPAAPCTHAEACPLYGGSHCTSRQKQRSVKKWCHFAYEDFDPPKELVRLSVAAKLPKERLTYSYLLTGTQQQTKRTTAANAVRVISDAFPLPGGKIGLSSGHYGCCAKGLVLLTGNRQNIERAVSGSVITNAADTGQQDAKSGAFIMELK